MEINQEKELKSMNQEMEIYSLTKNTNLLNLIVSSDCYWIVVILRQVYS